MNADVSQPADASIGEFGGLEDTFPRLEDLSEALDQAYPKFDMSLADVKLQADRACVERLCQELHSRLQPNALRVCYEAPFVASTAGDLAWGDESYEVYLPIRQPIGTWSSSAPQLVYHTDELGFVTVKIRMNERPPKRVKHAKEKLLQPRLQPLAQKQKLYRVGNRKENGNNRHHKDKKKKAVVAEREPLDHLKTSDGQSLAAGAALKVTARLVKSALQHLASDLQGEVIIHRLRLDKDCGTVRVWVEARPEFFVSATPPLTSGEAESRDGEEASAESPKLVSFDFPVPAALDATTDQHLSASPEPAKPQLIELRITPALRLPSEGEAQQAFATPVATTEKLARDAWTLQYPLDEAAILACVARADRGLRLRVWRGIAELCQREAAAGLPVLACLGDRRLPLHCMMELAESEIHSSSCGDEGERLWQRASCADCTCRLLESLRDRLAEGRLPHYFNREVNLLGRVSPRDCRAAAAKLDFYLRKPAALVRAALRATAPAGSSACVDGDGRSVDD